MKCYILPLSPEAPATLIFTKIDLEAYLPDVIIWRHLEFRKNVNNFGLDKYILQHIIWEDASRWRGDEHVTNIWKFEAYVRWSQWL